MAGKSPTVSKHTRFELETGSLSKPEGAGSVGRWRKRRVAASRTRVRSQAFWLAKL